MEHTKHLWRAAILLILLLLVVVVGRHAAIPDSFGELGFYRSAALDEFMDKELEHGAPDACAECHDDIADAKATGGHASVQCEVCHTTLSSHVREGEQVAEMLINRSYRLCAGCHQALRARPADMVQIDLREHLELEPDEVIPAEACLDCHDVDSVHSP